MVSIRQSVFNIYNQNNDIKLSDLREMFSNTSKEVLSGYLHQARKASKQISLESINIHTLEPMIVKLLNKSPNAQNLKLALDLLKAKIADKGMDDKLDIDKYILKGKSCQEEVDESTDLILPIDDDLTHKELAIEPEDNPWYDYDKSIELEDEE